MASDLTGIDLQQLAALAAIGRTHSFSRAADELGYTQSAVSQQVARLERLVGHRLVERPGGPRPVSLTPAGEALLRHADAIVDRLATAAADLRALAEGTAGTLRVGTFQSAGARLLPPALRAFTSAWPGVRVELTEAEHDDELLGLVEAGDLDLTFVVLPVPGGVVEVHELLRDPYVVAVAPGSPLASGSGPVRVRELDGLPLLTYGHMRDVHGVENRLGRPALAEQVRFRSHDSATLAAMAALDLGVAVVSWLSLDPARTDVVVRPLAGVAPRVVGLARHRDRYVSPAAEAFEAAVRQAAQQVQPPAA